MNVDEQTTSKTRIVEHTLHITFLSPMVPGEDFDANDPIMVLAAFDTMWGDSDEETLKGMFSSSTREVTGDEYDKVYPDFSKHMTKVLLTNLLGGGVAGRLGIDLPSEFAKRDLDF